MIIVCFPLSPGSLYFSQALHSCLVFCLLQTTFRLLFNQFQTGVTRTFSSVRLFSHCDYEFELFAPKRLFVVRSTFTSFVQCKLSEREVLVVIIPVRTGGCASCQQCPLVVLHILVLVEDWLQVFWLSSSGVTARPDECKPESGGVGMMQRQCCD